MHDTLLQSTQGFVLKVQAAANLVPGGTVARQMLEDALLKADTIMTEGRDRIQSLRTLGVEPCDLPEALERLGGALSGDGSQHTVQIEGDARTLNASVADEVYQIAREAMTNAFRHAKAKSVETQLVYGNDMLRLRVRDDGRGFDPAAFGETRISGHWGLTSMRERAEGMGAKLVIRSHLGVGTDIELVVPAQSAYG
jgi:signal transduction histidine kinase